MNIVFLDAFTTNPGDLDWQPLMSLGNLTLYDRTAPEEVIERAKDADVIISNKVVLDKMLMEKLPRLRYICVAATGYNNIDIATAKQRGILVSNVVGYSTDSVAQIVFALLLVLTNRVETYSGEVHEGHWAKSPDFSYWHEPIRELSGLILGIYGFGRIGKAVANIALSLGMKVIVHRRNPEKDKVKNVKYVTFEKLLEMSDVLSLHAPLTPDNQGIFDMQTFERMKSSSILINTARGPIVNEYDLADALKNKRIAGAGLDVLCKEPPEGSNPLFGLDNCVITPHQAWASQASRQRLLTGIIDNIRSFTMGKPINVIA